MARYTVSNLRAMVAAANEICPLDEPNGYGDYDRFFLDQAYGGYCVDTLSPGSTGHGSAGCYFHDSARKTAVRFFHFLWEHYPDAASDMRVRKHYPL